MLATVGEEFECFHLRTGRTPGGRDCRVAERRVHSRATDKKMSTL